MGWWTDVKNATSDAGDWVGDRWNDVSGKTASREGARAQTRAGEQANKTIWDMYQQNRTDMAPYREQGTAALGSLASLVNSGELDRPFGETYQDAGYQGPGAFDAAAVLRDPGYQMRLKEGMGAIENSAAARGGLQSGATLKALMGYGQGLASEEVGNAYNRFADQRNFGRDVYSQDRNFGYGSWRDRMGDFNQRNQMRYSRLADLAGIGQSSTNATAAAGQNAASQVGGNLIGMGNARAAGMVGGYNSQRDTLMGLLKGGGQAAMMAFGGG